MPITPKTGSLFHAETQVAIVQLIDARSRVSLYLSLMINDRALFVPVFPRPSFLSAIHIEIH